MITAVEALGLPTCILSEEERLAADKLEGEIEACVREKMSIKGIVFHTKETRPNVIVEVGRRFILAGWMTDWAAIEEEGRFNKAKRNHVGWQLSMAPSQASHTKYAESTKVPIGYEGEDACAIARPSRHGDCAG